MDTSFAQSIVADTDATMVIANGGLRMRNGPGKDYSTLTVIPFGARIKYMDEYTHGRDSIRIQTELEGVNEYIYGYWVKVAYQNKSGYVLDVFLDKKIKGRFDDLLSDEFVLIYPGCGCNQSNIHNPQKWNWYGYFKTSDSTLLARRIDISYYKTREYTCDLFINATETKDLQFIVGSKSEKLNTEIDVQYANLNLAAWYGSSVDRKVLEKFNLELEEYKAEYEEDPPLLYLNRGGTRTALNTKKYGAPILVELIGDIDGDGLNDYIIRYGEKGSILVLYLTKTGNTNLIKAEAIFYAGYCC
ncbi:MAG: SH3 domain-containing protein [Saprospiraceae bacterium]